MASLKNDLETPQTRGAASVGHRRAFRDHGSAGLWTIAVLLILLIVAAGAAWQFFNLATQPFRAQFAYLILLACAIASVTLAARALRVVQKRIHEWVTSGKERTNRVP